MIDEMSPDLNAAIATQCEARLEILQSIIDDDRAAAFDDLRDQITGQPFDDTAAIGLDLADQLAVVQEHADDYGIDLENVKVADLRTWIERQAAAIVCYLGEARAIEVLDDLQNVLDRNGVDIEELRSSNRYEMFRHYAERGGGGNVQIYEYRNLEGERVHIDVAEIHLDGLTLYFETRLDDVSAEEEEWDGA